MNKLTAQRKVGTMPHPFNPCTIVGRMEDIIPTIYNAQSELQPAYVGWTVVPAWEYTNFRRWFRHPDKMIADSFGVVSVRANLYPDHEFVSTGTSRFSPRLLWAQRKDRS